MDNCYQRRDNATSFETVQCNPNNAGGGKQGRDNGVFQGYGLVYFLIKHGITVYWTISPTKTTFTGSDVTVDSGTTTNVVTHWSWTELSFSPSYLAPTRWAPSRTSEGHSSSMAWTPRTSSI